MGSRERAEAQRVSGDDGFGAPKTEAEHAADALKGRPLNACRVRGCVVRAGIDRLCPAHRKQRDRFGAVPRSMDEIAPKVEGLCNWPTQLGRGRCRAKPDACGRHRFKGAPP
jgi:hypothetical protein